jgi:hypothetical protein
VKILGRFAYNATTIRPGMRKQRRDVLHGVMQYEIAEITGTDTAVTHDAIVFEDLLGKEQRLLGWAGGLWSPMRLNGPDGPPTTLEDLKASCQRVYPIGPGSDNPITDGYFALKEFGPDDVGNLDGLADRDEAIFTGQVISQERGLAIERFTELASQVLLIDGAPYARRLEPNWRVAYLADTVTLIGIASAIQSIGFRLDRLAEARAYAAENYRGTNYQYVQPLDPTRRGHLRLRRPVEPVSPDDIPPRGRVIAADPAYLLRDDLSYLFAKMAPELLEPKFQGLLPLLPLEATEIWRRHAREVMRLNANVDTPYFLPTDVALDDFQRLSSMLKEASLPTASISAQEDLLSGPYGMLERHLAFERKYGRLPALKPAECEAIAAIAI